MTATDELRRLLDERGVAWIGTSFSKPAKGHPTNTSLGEEHHEATFIEYDDGNVLRLFDLTPAQAIEATLGSDLKAENDKRIYDRCLNRVGQLEAENAELRELVRIMHGELVSCEDNGYVCGGHKFDERVRELGIEVDG